MASQSPRSKDYESWSFWGRSFLTALAFSVLWHFFWFFAITIVVSPLAKKEKPRPVLVSLGPVLDDTIFKTIVDTGPRLTQTYYHQLSDFSPAVEIQAKTADRHLPGDVVSVPFRQKFFRSIKEMVGGFKVVPDFDVAPRIGLRVPDKAPKFFDDLEDRRLLNFSGLPPYPSGVSPAFKNSEIGIRLSVDSAGLVRGTEVLRSTGSPELDEFWSGYVKTLRFSERPSAGGKPESGSTTLRFFQDEDVRS